MASFNVTPRSFSAVRTMMDSVCDVVMVLMLPRVLGDSTLWSDCVMDKCWDNKDGSTRAISQVGSNSEELDQHTFRDSLFHSNLRRLFDRQGVHCLDLCRSDCFQSSGPRRCGELMRQHRCLFSYYRHHRPNAGRGHWTRHYGNDGIQARRG